MIKVFPIMRKKALFSHNGNYGLSAWSNEQCVLERFEPIRPGAYFRFGTAFPIF